jgi:hypothetical protein
VVVLLVAGTGVALLLTRGDSPTTMALKSGQAIGRAAGLTLVGTMAGAPASMTVTRAGTVEGTYTSDDIQVSRITIGGATYLRAPHTFWSANGIDQVSALQAGGSWAKAPVTVVNLSFASLTPGAIARVLEHVGSKPNVVPTTLDGSKVIKLSRRGVSYYIKTTSPYPLVAISHGGSRSYSFRVTPLTATTIGPAFRILDADVPQLQAAPDPGALILPDEKIRFNPDCKSSSSCAVTGKVTLSDPGTPTILLKMTVDFSASRSGATFAKCTNIMAVSGIATVKPTCEVSGSVWSQWFNSHLFNFTTWARPHFEALVNSAGDITALQTELSQEQQVG